MTNTELIQVIKTEIDRLYNGDIPEHDQQCDFSDGYLNALSRVDEFLDTLEEKSENLRSTKDEVKSYRRLVSVSVDEP